MQATTWVKLEHMLCERSQMQKRLYGFVQMYRKGKSIETVYWLSLEAGSRDGIK